MWSAWSEAAALLVLLAATSPYAAVVTGYGILHLTSHSATIGDCTIANGILTSLWVGNTTVAEYSTSNYSSLVLSNDTGIYTAVYREGQLLGVGEGGKVVIGGNGVIDVAGEFSIRISNACTHPLSAGLVGNELVIACNNTLLYYSIGSPSLVLTQVTNITAVLGLRNSVVLVSTGDKVKFIDIKRQTFVSIACEPVMWGVGSRGIWVACRGSPTDVFMYEYESGLLSRAEIGEPYKVCSSFGEPCKIAENSLYIEKLVFEPYETSTLFKTIMVDNLSVILGKSNYVPPTYVQVPSTCLMTSPPGFVASGEPIPTRLLVGTLMIVCGLISVLLGYRSSKQKNVSGEG